MGAWLAFAGLAAEEAALKERVVSLFSSSRRPEKPEFGMGTEISVGLPGTGVMYTNLAAASEGFVAAVSAALSISPDMDTLIVYHPPEIHSGVATFTADADRDVDVPIYAIYGRFGVSTNQKASVN